MTLMSAMSLDCQEQSSLTVADPHQADTVESAFAAWRQMGNTGTPSTPVEVLKESRSIAVCRIHGVGHQGSAVIARRCSEAIARSECIVYEKILPALPMRSLLFYGSVTSEDKRSRWIFTEDAGGKKYNSARQTLRQRAGAWLAQMHVHGADQLYAGADLPDRSVSYFLEHLQAALASLSPHHDRPSLSRKDEATIEATLSLCALLKSKWDDFERLCTAIPTTLNHGDFASRNMRLAEDGSLLVFDWEDVGWGPPTLDLIQSSPRAFCDSANPALSIYQSIMCERWPQLGTGVFDRLAALGRIFWYVVAIRLDADSLLSDCSERRLRNLRSYRAGLTHAVGVWDQVG
jgi:thiamine kinase-like enzyme